jgi:opacity protein-like surface antigen
MVAAAQTDAPRYEARGSIGLSSFLDDGPDNHLATTGALRYYIWKRLAVEGEVQYLRRNDVHSDWVLLPNVVWDFRRGRRVTPYVTGGVGYMRSSYGANGRVLFNTSDTFAQFGFGVKIYLNRHWYVAPDFRVGWEPHVRLGATVGYSWR